MTPSPRLDVRADFPFLSRVVNGKPIAYLDNAATTQKPRAVLDCLQNLYCSGVSNVHRAVNFLADEVTQQFEEARQTAARLLGAHSREIIFTGNSTQAINIVCGALKKPLRVLTTTLEHHSNLLPWAGHGQVDFVPWNHEGVLDLASFHRQLDQSPDLVAIAHASNFLGTLHPIDEIVSACRARNIPVLVDASQSIAHVSLNVRRLGCDYLVFSGHKVYGPSGVGVLYVRNEIIDAMRPVLLGGNMVKEVHARSFVPNDVPYRFEAGTPNIEGVTALGAALRYFLGLGYESIAAHEQELTRYAKEMLSKVPHLKLLGPPTGRPSAPLATFHIKGLESGVIAKALGNRANVVVRSGFHCAQPAHEYLALGPTVRASFAIYNTRAEIDAMLETLHALARFCN
jgi:cysteine desulfurase / selenocysteine lyase